MPRSKITIKLLSYTLKIRVPFNNHIHASITLIIKLLMSSITLYLIYYLACPS